MSTWLALVLVDMVAAASLARCFNGPGELTAALTTLVAVHLAVLAGRRKALGRRRSWWALALVAMLAVPLAFVLGSSLFDPVPGAASWHLLESDLRAGWGVFYRKVAPVPELPGLVLVSAWATGAVGLLSELVSSREKIPAALALVPAISLYLFASALGTGSWRGASLASIAGLACWYLVAVVKEREGSRGALFATTDTGLGAGRRAGSHRTGIVVFRMALLAAAAAAIVGPNLPGARSSGLVAWRGPGAGGSRTATTAVGGGSVPASGEIEVSSLVQVGEEEVNDPSIALFSVYSSVPTREQVAVLDEFNGNSWSASPQGAPAPLGRLQTSLVGELRRLPRLTQDGPGRERIVQIFSVQDLGGRNLPSAGVPFAVAGAKQATLLGPGGTLVSSRALRQGSVYAVASVLSDPSARQLLEAATDTSDSQLLELAPSVPSRLVALADEIVAGATTPYEKALDIEAYLSSSRFRYQLPARTPSGLVSAARGYTGLVDFLFGTRTGYCQQFATAFAVLARIEGLPTRIAVGFLPGTRVGHDEWQVDGNDTHAWPQVLFEGYGWIDFEPTPGTSVLGSSSPTIPSTTAKGGASATSTTVAPAQNFHPSPSGGATNKASGPLSSGGPGGPSPLWLFLPLVLLVWALGMPSYRRLKLRRSMGKPRVGVLAAWAEASRTLELAGVRRRRAETYLELAKRTAATGVLSKEAEQALYDLAGLATTASYAACPPGQAATARALGDARMVIRSAREKVARWQLIVAAVDPRGVVTRRTASSL